MPRTWLQRLIIVSLVLPACAREASAQWPKNLSDVVLALPSTTSGNTRAYTNTRLFDGVVNATIFDQNGNPGDFAATDVIAFQVRSRTGVTPKARPTGAGFDSPIRLTRAEFDTWAKDHAPQLLEVLFPSGLAAAVSGRDTSTLYSQQLFLTTILDIATSENQQRRPSAALVDAEWMNVESDGAASGSSAWATQGLYAFRPWISVQARYGSLTRALSTASINVAVDVHPFIERGDYREGVMVRVGGMGRGGFMYSSTKPVTDALTTASSIPLPVFDYSGGGWASVLHEFGPVLVGGGSLFQLTKHQALEGSDDDFRKAFAAAINDRGLEYDATVGGTAKAPVTRRTSVIGSYAGTFGLNSVIDRAASHAILGSVMYELGPRATVNGGYKTTSLTGGRAHSIFFQGNFAW
jgi:hypothetical protein